MEKLFDESIIHAIPFEKGIIAALKHDEEDDRLIIQYKVYSIENGFERAVPKELYSMLKFGDEYEVMTTVVDHPFYCKTAKLQGERLFNVMPDGHASILDKEGNVYWQGEITYKGKGPSDIAVKDNILWASFKDNAIIRYNLTNMREELRIGGGDCAFSQPEGLWLSGENLIVCNSGTNSLLKVNTNSYSVKEYFTFDEPVYQYFFIENKELVRLGSGLYIL